MSTQVYVLSTRNDHHFGTVNFMNGYDKPVAAHNRRREEALCDFGIAVEHALESGVMNAHPFALQTSDTIGA